MGEASAELVRDALRTVLFPNFRRDVVTLGMVSDVRIDGGTVHVDLRPGTDKADVLQALSARIDEAVRRVPGVARVELHVASATAGRGRDPAAGRAPLPGVRHVIAVSSAKGGVGKSTVAANLALALAAGGRRVGLVDLDVYGPSVPIMFGTTERPQMTAAKRLIPIERFGIRLLSMGFFLDEQSPVIWRGPIVMGIVRQFLHEVDWGPTDALIVDLPPGTGDAPLTLVQQVPVSGGLIVTTPQDVALLDVGRGIGMFAQVRIPVLGIVENMSGYVCPSCGTEDPIFDRGGAERLARRFEIPVLARLPIAPAIRDAGDRGRPVVLAEPDHPTSAAFAGLARRVWDAVEHAAAAPTAH